MSARGKRDNVVAGVFMLGTLVALVVLIMWIAKAVESWETRTPYMVRFAIADGATGLKKGSEVRLGGQRVGNVTKVTFNPEKGAAQSIDVEIEIKAEVGLMPDAKFTLESPLLGSVSNLNIYSVGTGAVLAKPRTVFTAALAAPSFLKSAGYGDEQRSQLQDFIANAKGLTVQMKSMLDKVDERVTPALDNVRDATADVKTVTGDLRGRFPAWSARITDVLAHLDEVLVDAKTIPGEVKGAIAVARKLIDDASPRVIAALDDVKDLVHKVNNETYAKVQKVLAEADRALTNAADVAQQVKGWLPEIQVTLANLRLASDQLKLTMTEVRRNPWRLLYQPGKKELERELLYDAARSYASAVSDLRAATSGLEQVSAGAGNPLPAEQVQALKAQVDEAMRKYREAEAAFMKRLLAE